MASMQDDLGRLSTARRLALPRTWRGWLGLVVVAGLAGGLGAFALTWRPADRDPPQSRFAPDAVARGAVLAKLGDCAVCHTAEGGRPLAGSRALATPFGVLYSTNLTPDVETGIGLYSQKAFRRAMTEGVDRRGRHLYPALPYEHFRRVRDEDLDAIYAYLMTRSAVEAKPPSNRLIPPLGFRPLLFGWKLLFLRGKPPVDDAAQTVDWNRGRYLVEGLGHCGGCHSPRNALGAENFRHGLAGGAAEGWRAPPLDASNPAARAWTADSLYAYLRTGLSPDHAAAAGPMGPVVESLSEAPEADVKAIAVYVASQINGSPGAQAIHPSPIDNDAKAAKAQPRGATLFAGACAGCHAPGAPMANQDRPSLALASSVRDDTARGAMQAMLQGVTPPVAGRGPAMPGFAATFRDEDLADIAAYVRARYSDQPAWKNLKSAARQTRKEGAAP